jgi:hypothetical protein
MTWISLICLLVLSGTALGGYGGGYGGASVSQVPKLIAMMLDRPAPRPIISQGYGQVQQPLTVDWSSTLTQQQDLTNQQILQPTGYGTTITRTLPIQGYGQVNQGYGTMPSFQQFDQVVVPQVPVLTPADQLCRGQRPETIIPIEDNRKFVVCLDDSKGVEQQCPKGLFYHPTSLRCERKLGPLENICASQPCLNGGQCIPTDSSYQCQCAPGFDGQTCELDARICQTQFPCGQSPDVKCQSFRLGAALQYICIFQGGYAYGLSTSQIVSSPCRDIDGPQALSVTNHGFIMCDGERMHIESCPGGTVWDDLNKACVWPDMQVAPQLDQTLGYGQISYGQQQPKLIPSTYGTEWTVPQPEQPKLIQSTYGTEWTVPQPEQPKLIQSTYGTQWTVPQPEQPKLIQPTYGSQMNLIRSLPPPPPPRHHHRHHHTKHLNGYNSQIVVPQLEQPTSIQSSYGAQWPAPQPDQPKFIDSSYGLQTNFIKPQLDLSPQVQTSYGSQTNFIKPQFDLSPQVQTSYGYQQPQLPSQDVVAVKQLSAY